MVNKSTKHTYLKRPIKAHTQAWQSANGRGHKGRLTSWNNGGGHARLYRHVDFIRKHTQGIVINLERDPNRAGTLARIFNPDTKKQNYILAPKSLKKGQVIRSNSMIGNFGIGHSRPLKYIPASTNIYNLSVAPGKKGKILRAPGAYGRILKRTFKLVKIQLKSGQYRWFDIRTMATKGVVYNPNHHLTKYKKAGQSRWLGKRPTVRGVAMNPVDHPHGGGEGKTSGGRPAVTPWAKPTKGKKTTKK